MRFGIFHCGSALLVSCALSSAEDELGSKPVRELIRQLSDQQWHPRAAAAKALARRGGDARDAVPALIVALGDRDGAVRVPAAEALGAIGPAAAGAIDALVARMGDGYLPVRRASRAALLKIDPDARIVVALAKKEASRIAAIRALSDYPAKTPQVVSTLLTALNDEDKQVRIEAAGAVSKTGLRSPEDADAVVNSLPGKAVEVRRFAAAALGSLGPDGVGSVPALMKLAGDEDSEVRYQAATSLGKIGPAARRASPALVAHWLRKEHSRPKQAAIKALAIIWDHPDSSETIRDALKQSYPVGSEELPRQAARFAATHKMKNVVPVLESKLTEALNRKQHDWEVWEFSQAVARIGLPESLPLLVRCYTQTKWDDGNCVSSPQESLESYLRKHTSRTLRRDPVGLAKWWNRIGRKRFKDAKELPVPKPPPVPMLLKEKAVAPVNVPPPDTAQQPAAPLKLTLAVAPQRGSEVVLEGRLSRPMAIPDINDFRLERMDKNEMRWVPMLFGDRRSMAWPKLARCDRLLLNVRPLRSDDREKKIADTDNSTVRFYADAPLQQHAEYRLTWNCRDAKATPSQSVRFRYVAADPEEIDAKPTNADVPKRFYLCELLFRHEGVLFLGQTVVPRLAPREFSMAAAGFIDDTHVSPPNPGYARVRSHLEQVERVGKSAPVRKPPLAERTRHYGANADEHGLTVRVSDMARGFNLGPDDLKRPGDVFFTMFASVNPHYPLEAVIFRFELLEGNVQRLRQDSAHWKRRTEKIAKEVLARRDWLLEQPRQRLPVAAYVLNDADLLKLIRGELREWLEKPDDKLDDHAKAPTETRRRMQSHLHVLLCLGEPADLPLLAKLAAHEASGGYLISYARTIGKQYGVAQAADVWLPLLRRTAPASDPRNLALLRTVEPGIPARLRADDVLIGCARLLDRSPSEFGFQLAAARLLEIEAKVTLTDEERNVLRTRVQNQSGCWYAPSTVARKKAVERMSKLLELVAVDSRGR